MGQTLLRFRPRFGRPVRPTQCVGCAEPTARTERPEAAALPVRRPLCPSSGHCPCTMP